MNKTTHKSLLLTSRISSIWQLANGANVVYHQSNTEVNAYNYTLQPNATVTVQPGSTGKLAGVLSGSNGLTVNPGGPLTLTRSNTYTGPTNLLGGSSLILDNGAIAGSLSVASGANMLWSSNSGTSYVYSQPISGSGSITLKSTKAAPDTTPYNFTSSTTTFSGVWQLDSARLQASTQGAVGTGAITVNSGSQFFVASNNTTFSNSFTLTGSGWPSVFSADIGAIRHEGSNLIFSGPIMISASGSAIGSNSASTATFSGVISGTGSIDFNNPGITTLTGLSTNTGAKNVNKGTVKLNAGTFQTGIVRGTLNIQSGAVAESVGNNLNIFPIGTTDIINVNNGGTLRVTGHTTENAAWYLGTLNLSNTGTSAQVVTSDASMVRVAYNANTTINSSGTVGNSWSAGIRLVNGNSRTFTINNSNTFTISGVFSDFSSLAGCATTKTGTGELLLTATNTSTGDMSITAGSVGVTAHNSARYIISANASISGNTATSTIGALTFNALSADLTVKALTTTTCTRLSCTALTAASGFTVDLVGAMNAGTYPILVKTSGYSGTPTLGTNTSGRTVSFSWSGNTLNAILT